MKQNENCIKELASHPGTKYYFFLALKGNGGKPVMLLDNKVIPESERVAVMNEAKSNLNCMGEATYDKKKNINLAKVNRTLPDLPKVVKEFTKISRADVALITLNGVKVAVVGKEAGASFDDEKVKEEFPKLGLKPTLATKGNKDVKAKRHADPAAPSAGLSKLLDLHKNLSKELKSTPEPEQQKQLATKLKQIEGQIEKMKGFSTKALGAEYANEDKEFGFRRDLENTQGAKSFPKPQPPAELALDESLLPNERKKKVLEHQASVAEYEKELKTWEGLVHRQEQVTKYNRTPEEKLASEVKVSKGRMRAQGQGFLSDKKGYVVDPQTGKLRHFTEGESEVEVEVDDRETGRKKTIVQKQTIHHSTPLAGEEVAGAGEMELEAGVLKSISNNSGHYKPKAIQLIQTLELLLKQGALLDKEYQMIDETTGLGKDLEGELLALHANMEQVKRNVSPKLSEWKKLKVEIDLKQSKGEDCAAEIETFEELSTTLKPDLDLIAKARKALKRRGAAPSNRIRDVEVKHSELRDDMTGGEVKKGLNAETTNAKDFLQTGGGEMKVKGKTTTTEEKKKAKVNLHEQIKKTTEKRLDALDEEAVARAERISGKPAKGGADAIPGEADKLKANMPETLKSLKSLLVERAGTITEREKKELLAGIARLEDAIANPKKFTDEGLKQLSTELEERKQFFYKQQMRKQGANMAPSHVDDSSVMEAAEQPDDMKAFAKKRLKDPSTGYYQTAEQYSSESGKTLEEIFEEIVGRPPVVASKSNEAGGLL